MNQRAITVRVVVAVALLAGYPARAQERSDPGEVAKLRAEVARLQQEVRDLRQLLVQAVQNDQQHFDMLLKLIQGSGSGSAGASQPGQPQRSPAKEAITSSAPAAGAQASAAATTGTITGRVRAEGSLGDAYVYIDGYRSAPARNRTIEIRQKDKRFVPSVEVVQVGTRAIFPNFDTVIHNVFSTTPDNRFDLGNVKAGDETAPVVLMKPGHVEVYCNLHSKMRADLLVVSNPYFAKVAPDGSFQIAGVPVGPRKLALWGPRLAATTQRVEVTSRGASVTITATPASLRPHLNKQGQPYGSYDE
jgi:plastocyanin/outer membrane murein-binding lipoprotein Lpp